MSELTEKTQKIDEPINQKKLGSSDYFAPVIVSINLRLRGVFSSQNN